LVHTRKIFKFGGVGPYLGRSLARFLGFKLSLHKGYYHYSNGLSERSWINQ